MDKGRAGAFSRRGRPGRRRRRTSGSSKPWTYGSGFNKVAKSASVCPRSCGRHHNHGHTEAEFASMQIPRPYVHGSVVVIITMDIRKRFWPRCQNRVRVSTVLCSGDMMLCAAPGSWGGLLGFWASGSRGLGGSKPGGNDFGVTRASHWWFSGTRCPNRAS